MIFVVDFDGTIAKEDTVDRLLETHADSRWETLEADWLAGRITALECMRDQIALVRADPATLADFFKSIELDPHFEDFWRYASRHAHVMVVSDGLDRAIHTALDAANLGPLDVFANQLEFIAPDSLELKFPYRKTDCEGGNGVCKCSIAAQHKEQHQGPLILIGDGKSDVCLAARADVVFAKGSLIKHCQQNGIPHIPFENFSQILESVQTWPEFHPVTAAA